MRILVVTPYYYPHLGGSERYIEQLYSSVMKLDESIQVDVLTYNTNRSKKREKYRGMNIYRVGCMELLPGQFAIPNYFEVMGVLRRLKRAGGYQVVNAHTRFFESSWWGWRVARYFGAKAILTDHCADHPTHSNFVIRKVAEWVDQVVIPRLGKKYDLITAVSQATRTFLVQRGIKRTVEVIPNSVEIMPTPKRSVKKEIIVSFVGRKIEAKGADIFEAVTRQLYGEYPKCRFIEVSNRSHDQVMKILSKTDILLHPSRHHEGLPTVILEAGMMGCAVVATNKGGTKEVVIDGETGILAESSIEAFVAATRKLILDADLRLRLGTNLQTKVITEYNWDLTAKKMINTLRRANLNSSK